MHYITNDAYKTYSQSGINSDFHLSTCTKY